jgi:hypothetical protein
MKSGHKKALKDQLDEAVLFWQSNHQYKCSSSTHLVIFHLFSMMKLFLSLLLLLQASVASAKVLSLTIENIFEETEGKSIFVKFFAPWCET